MNVSWPDMSGVYNALLGSGNIVHVDTLDRNWMVDLVLRSNTDLAVNACTFFRCV